MCLPDYDKMSMHSQNYQTPRSNPPQAADSIHYEKKSHLFNSVNQCQSAM
jgi:hypothetical protein